MWRHGKYGLLAVWLVLAALAFPLAAKLTEMQSSNGESWLPHTAAAALRVDRTEFGVTAMPGLAGRYLDLTVEVRCTRK